MNRIPVVLCSFMLLCLSTTVHAATIIAGSCSSTDVQAEINVATTGDTVIVPPGNCTWTSTVTIANKGIKLTGAGIDQTTITDQGSGGAALAVVGASTANFVNISGFTFIKSANHPSGIVRIDGVMFSVAFRFHHNRIMQASSGARGIYIVDVYGLIDHNSFDVTATSGSVQSISIDGTNVSTDGGYSAWAQPLSLGTDKAVYVENNTITYDTSDTGVEDALDAYSGARFVVRYNQINNITMGHHGLDSGGNRSPVSYEVYNNTFTNNSTTQIRGWTVRGGTGVFFGNTYGGTLGAWHPITLMYYRACSSGLLCTSCWGNWGNCNGTKYKLVSNILSSDGSRQASASGAFGFNSMALDAVPICTSGAGTCSAFLDGTGPGGYPGRDQPGRGPGQVLEPIYAWNNTGATIGAYNLADPDNCNGLGVANYIAENRDFYSNTQRPGYTPYKYPHPLQAAGDPSTNEPPPTPTGVFVK